MPKPARKKSSKKAVPRKEHLWKMTVLAVVAMMVGWKYPGWSDTVQLYGQEQWAGTFRVAPRSVVQRGDAGWRAKIICFHDSKLGGTNTLFIDRGQGPFFVTNMDEADANTDGLAQVVFSLDGQGLIVRSHNGQDFSGGYNFAEKRILNAVAARNFAKEHELAKDDVFLSGPPLRWYPVKYNELKKYNVKGWDWKGQLRKWLEEN